MILCLCFIYYRNSNVFVLHNGISFLVVLCSFLDGVEFFVFEGALHFLGGYSGLARLGGLGA